MTSTGAVVATFATAMIVYSTALMATSSFASAETTLYQAQNGAGLRRFNDGATFHADRSV